MTNPDMPTLEEIEAARARIGPYVAETPVFAWRGPEALAALPPGTETICKLELFQHTGSFKARGAVNNLMSMSDGERARGVVAVSAGNHGAAVAYAARATGSDAVVYMPKTATPFRRDLIASYGGSVRLEDTIADAFTAGQQLAEEEGRMLIHPFEGSRTIAGPATLGMEFYRQAPGFDAVIVPIGGGGLIAGMAAAIKQLDPGCQVVGVEPVGAPTLTESLKAGKPLKMGAIETIADSLGAPTALPQTYGLTRDLVDDVVLIEDIDMKRGMAFLFANLKLAVEPAGAAAWAALAGPLRDRLAGKRVGLVICGSNIDRATFCRFVEEGSER